MTIVGQEKRVPRLTEKLDEISVVPGTDMSQFGMCRLDVGVNRRLHQLPKGLFFKGQQFQAATTSFAVRTTQSWSGQRAPVQNICQHHSTPHILHHDRHQRGQFIPPKGMSKQTRPVDITDGWVGVLVVGQVQVFHGQGAQAKCPQRVAQVLHVASNAEQLGGVHHLGRCLNHHLHRCVLLEESEAGVQHKNEPLCIDTYVHTRMNHNS